MRISSRWLRRLRATFFSGSIDDRPVWLVTPEDLILLKLIANRPRDYIDIADVRLLAGQLDEQYLRTWAAKLDLSARLEKVLQDSPFE